MKRLIALLFTLALVASASVASADGPTACYNNSSGTIQVKTCDPNANTGCNYNWTCISLGGETPPPPPTDSGYKLVCKTTCVPKKVGSTNGSVSLDDECGAGSAAVNCQVLPGYDGQITVTYGLAYDQTPPAATCATGCSGTATNSSTEASGSTNECDDADDNVTTCAICVSATNCSTGP
jgi:hypothetical protein